MSQPPYWSSPASFRPSSQSHFGLATMNTGSLTPRLGSSISQILTTQDPFTDANSYRDLMTTNNNLLALITDMEKSQLAERAMQQHQQETMRELYRQREESYDMVATLQKDNESLAHQLKEMEALKGQEKLMRETAQKQVSDAEKAARSNGSILSQTQSELHSEKRKNEELERGRETLAARLREVTDAWNDCKRHAIEESEEQKGLITDLRNQCRALEGEVAALSSQLTQAKSDIDRTYRALQRAEMISKEDRSRAIALELSLSQHQASLAAEEARGDQAREATARVEKANMLLKRDMGALQNLVQDLTNQLNDATAVVSRDQSLKQANDDRFAARYHEIQEKEDAMKIEIEDIKAELNIWETRAKEAESRCVALQKEVQSVQQVARAAQYERDQVEARVARERDNHETTLAQIKGDMNQQLMEEQRKQAESSRKLEMACSSSPSVAAVVREACCRMYGADAVQAAESSIPVESSFPTRALISNKTSNFTMDGDLILINFTLRDDDSGGWRVGDVVVACEGSGSHGKWSPVFRFDVRLGEYRCMNPSPWIADRRFRDHLTKNCWSVSDFESFARQCACLCVIENASPSRGVSRFELSDVATFCASSVLKLATESRIIVSSTSNLRVKSGDMILGISGSHVLDRSISESIRLSALAGAPESPVLRYDPVSAGWWCANSIVISPTLEISPITNQEVHKLALLFGACVISAPHTETTSEAITAVTPMTVVACPLVPGMRDNGMSKLSVYRIPRIVYIGDGEIGDIVVPYPYNSGAIATASPLYRFDLSLDVYYEVLPCPSDSSSCGVGVKESSRISIDQMIVIVQSLGAFEVTYTDGISSMALHESRTISPLTVLSTKRMKIQGNASRPKAVLAWTDVYDNGDLVVKDESSNDQNDSNRRYGGQGTHGSSLVYRWDRKSSTYRCVNSRNTSHDLSLTFMVDRIRRGEVYQLTIDDHTHGRDSYLAASVTLSPIRSLAVIGLAGRHSVLVALNNIRVGDVIVAHPNTRMSAIYRISDVEKSINDKVYVCVNTDEALPSSDMKSPLPSRQNLNDFKQCCLKWGAAMVDDDLSMRPWKENDLPFVENSLNAPPSPSTTTVSQLLIHFQPPLSVLLVEVIRVAEEDIKAMAHTHLAFVSAVHVTLVELQSCADQVRARLETVEAKQRDLRDRMMKLLQDQETISLGSFRSLKRQVLQLSSNHNATVKQLTADCDQLAKQLVVVSTELSEAKQQLDDMEQTASLGSAKASRDDMETQLAAVNTALSLANLKLQNAEDDKKLLATLSAKLNSSEKSKEKSIVSLQKLVDAEREGREREREEWRRRVQNLEATLDQEKNSPMLASSVGAEKSNSDAMMLQQLHQTQALLGQITEQRNVLREENQRLVRDLEVVYQRSGRNFQ